MAKTPCTQSTDSHYGRFIGRVGGLAVALGIGVAIANNPGVASAEDGQTSANGEGIGDLGVASTESSTKDDDPVKSVVKQLHSRFAEAREKAESTRENVSSRAADPSYGESRRVSPEPAGQATNPCKPRRSSKSTPKPPKPAPNPALVAVAGFVRRELEHAVTPARTHESVAPATAAVSQTVTTQAASPLGTPEQRDAEQTATETVNTLPVQLTKLVLKAGWYVTALERIQRGRRPRQGEPRAAEQVRRRVRDGRGVPAADSSIP